MTSFSSFSTSSVPPFLPKDDKEEKTKDDNKDEVTKDDNKDEKPKDDKDEKTKDVKDEKTKEDRIEPTVADYYGSDRFSKSSVDLVTDVESKLMEKDVEDKLSSVDLTDQPSDLPMDTNTSGKESKASDTEPASSPTLPSSSPPKSADSPSSPEVQPKKISFFSRIFGTSDSDPQQSSGDEIKGINTPEQPNKTQNNPSPPLTTYKMAADETQRKIQDREDSVRRRNMRRNFPMYYHVKQRSKDNLFADVENAVHRQKLFRNRRHSRNSPARYKQLDISSDDSVEEHNRFRKRPLLVDVNDRRRVPDVKRPRSSLRTRLSHGTPSDLDISDANFSLLT